MVVIVVATIACTVANVFTAAVAATADAVAVNVFWLIGIGETISRFNAADHSFAIQGDILKLPVSVTL